MEIPLTILDKLLTQVRKPARYVGGEFNVVVKDWATVDTTMVFAFPDVYEVGMSHLGLKILYGLVNQQPEYLMERVFAPWIDFEAELRKQQIPLFSLESRRSIKDFHVVGFTLQYEMSYSNLINMLDLSHIPLHSAQRDESQPLVIAGGPCAFNPEPLADFVDLFVLGEGEEVLLELLQVVREHSRKMEPDPDAFGNTGAKFRDRQALLQALAQIPGIYVPSFYQVSYLDDGRIQSVKPIHTYVPPVVQRRVVQNFDRAYFPVAPIVPNMEVVHDRITLEVFRGCQRGCRFCQAGVVYRPTRERRIATLMEQARELVQNTGHNEISLTSLSTGDYPGIEPLIRQLLAEFRQQGIAVSLPSLRIDSFSVDLAAAVQQGRKTGLTFAPEAGTQRLRDVINKGVTEEDLFRAADAAFKAGWSAIKLYFMVGLPTESEEDLAGIVALAHRVAELGTAAAREGRLKRRVQVTVSVSNFVPKPHTPFQWQAQPTLTELREKQEYLRNHLRDKRIVFNWHDSSLSFWEAVMAKGDRRLGAVLEAAWQKGCRFDGWSEHFDPLKWQNACADLGLDPSFYANRFIPGSEILPWDHLHPGISRDFLQKEAQAAEFAMQTPDCRQGGCSACGVCTSLGVDLETTELGGE